MGPDFRSVSDLAYQQGAVESAEQMRVHQNPAELQRPLSAIEQELVLRQIKEQREAREGSLVRPGAQ